LINEQIGNETDEQILSDGRQQITEEKLSVHAYIRLHYEPTRFNQEWRTPPLWGVADSAPYMHDGRAETLLESITMHDGEASGTRDRFLNLSLSDRHALIAFLETLVAPSNAPQPRS
jgi:cytochrome c peroxidase